MSVFATYHQTAIQSHRDWVFGLAPLFLVVSSSLASRLLILMDLGEYFHTVAGGFGLPTSLGVHYVMGTMEHSQVQYEQGSIRTVHLFISKKVAPVSDCPPRKTQLLADGCTRRMAPLSHSR